MILVTGGTGLIGSHLLFHLINSGKTVRSNYRSKASIEKVRKVFGYYTNDPSSLVEKIDWVQADITELGNLDKLFIDVDYVYHCAALISFDPKDYKILDNLTGYAINYFKDKVEPNKKFKIPNEAEKKALKNLIKKLREIDQSLNPEEIQTIVYSSGKENGYEKNLREWFKLIYQVVFGEENGPRMGFFISFFGLKETIELINDKIK